MDLACAHINTIGVGVFQFIFFIFGRTVQCEVTEKESQSANIGHRHNSCSQSFRWTLLLITRL